MLSDTFYVARTWTLKHEHNIIQYSKKEKIYEVHTK